MMNKCTMKMAWKTLYNVRDPHKRGIEKLVKEYRKRITVAQ